VKWLALFALGATLTGSYEALLQSSNQYAESVASDEANSVRYDLEPKINDHDRRIDDLEREWRYR